MKITLVHSAICPRKDREPQFFTSYLINDKLAIDAGSLGFGLDLESQQRVRHVLISHSHIDHIASLPIFLENTTDFSRPPVTVYGSEPVLDALRQHIFNGYLWPDLVHATVNSQPFFRLQTLEPGRAFEIEGVRITPVPVNHAVPAMGFLLEEANAAVALSLDTGPTEELWRWANRLPKLDAVFLEVTFPNSMEDLARIAKHLTPRLFREEIGKLSRPAKIVAIHLKASVAGDVLKELQALDLPDLEVIVPGKEYCF